MICSSYVLFKASGARFVSSIFKVNFSFRVQFREPKIHAACALNSFSDNFCISYVHKSSFTAFMSLRLVSKRLLISFCVIGYLYAYSDSIRRMISCKKGTWRLMYIIFSYLAVHELRQNTGKVQVSIYCICIEFLM